MNTNDGQTIPVLKIQFIPGGFNIPKACFGLDEEKTTARSPWLQQGNCWSAGDLAVAGFIQCRSLLRESLLVEINVN